LVVLPPANLCVGGQERELGWGDRPGQPVEAMFEDGVDMPVGARADGDGPGTGGLEAGVAVAFGKTQDAEARAVALLGVRPVREDGLDEGRGLRADGAGPGDEARGRPLEVALMRFGHVGGVGGVPAAEMAAGMGGHPLPAMEELDRRHGQAGIDEFVAEGVGDGVVVPVELDMVVDIHASVVLPFADDERLGRQGPKGGAIQALEELPAAGAVQAHRARVQGLQQLGDARVERGEREEPLVAQPRQDPPGDDEHPRLDLRFISWFSGSGREDDRAGEPRELLVGLLQPRLVAARDADAAFQLIGHEGGGDPPKY